MLLAGCGAPTAEETRAEIAHLRTALDRHRAKYGRSVVVENHLARESLAWLDGAPESRDRSVLRREAYELMERWAKVYFVPRTIHADLAAERYRSRAVRDAHERILAHLKKRYFELHDYQRYAQNISEDAASGVPVVRIRARLDGFRARLIRHSEATDDVFGAVLALQP